MKNFGVTQIGFFCFLLFIFLYSSPSIAGSITKPNSFTDGTPAVAAEVNANFDTVYDEVNRVGAVLEVYSSKVGIGTTTPVGRLEVYQGVLRINEESSGNSPTLYLRNTNSLKAKVQSSYGFAFETPANTEVMAIDNAGNVGIGTTSPGEKLEVNGMIDINKSTSNTIWDEGLKIRRASVSSQYGLINQFAGTLNIISVVEGGGVDGAISFKRHNAGSGTEKTNMYIGTTGNVGIGTTNTSGYNFYVVGSAYTTGTWAGSDRRWKKNIVTLSDSLGKVLQLRGVNYEWRREEYPDSGFTEGTQIGLIAQEVEEVVPELVNTNDDGFKAVSYEKLTPLLVEAIKELKAENNALKEEILQIKEAIGLGQ